MHQLKIYEAFVSLLSPLVTHLLEFIATTGELHQIKFGKCKIKIKSQSLSVLCCHGILNFTLCAQAIKSLDNYGIILHDCKSMHTSLLAH